MVNDDSRPPSSESPSFTYRGQSASAYLDAQRKNVLAEVDNRPFSWFHVKICCVAGVGFFTDSYDIFAISITSTMLGYVYGDAQSNCNRQLSNLQEFGVKVATPIGTLIGQLLFGWLADILGRKRMYGVELIIIIVGTLTQAMAGSAHAVGIISALIVWRFLMGIGIGGDYPLSAVITSEFASKRTRGRLMTAVFAFQGWGQLIASLVALIVTAAYKRSITNNDVFLCIDDSRLESGFPFEIPIDTMWRIVIGFGCVPACIALYFRLTIPESPRFTLDIERNIAHATRDIEMMYTTNAGLYSSDPDLAVERIEVPRATRRDFIAYFRKSKNAKVLLGCVWSWFVLDIAFYGLNLNTNTILQGINFDVSGNHDHDNMTIITSNGTNITINTPPNATNAIIYVNTMQVQGAHGIHNPSAVYNNLLNTAAGNVVLSVAGLIPGFWVSFCFIDSWGRKPIQLMGFVFLSVLFLIMGFGFDKLNGSSATPLAVLYCLSNFFQNFGPNTTTFIIPGEVFPTRYRSTAHGISAASGKLGAVIAQIITFVAKQKTGKDSIKTVLEVYAFFMLSGILSTLLVPETRGYSLEDLCNENQEQEATNRSRTRRNSVRPSAPPAVRRANEIRTQ